MSTRDMDLVAKLDEKATVIVWVVEIQTMKHARAFEVRRRTNGYVIRLVRQA